MAKLKTAIIGCGNIYRVHADVISKIEVADLVVVVDIKENRAKEAARLYGCNYYKDYKELLNTDIDVVHICTPHFLHSSMAIKLMEAGIDVLVEKPLALNVKQGLEILKTTKNTGQRLGVVFQNRFNENSLRVKKILEDGSLGRIIGIKGIVTWFRDKDYYLQDKWRGRYETEGGGVLINQAIHTLDLLQWFAGEVKAVKGSVDTRVLDEIIEVEDTAEATLYFANGAIGLFYSTNCFTSNSPVEIEIHCEGGMLKLTGGELKITASKNDLGFSEEKDVQYKSYWGSGHQKLIEGFYRDLIDNTDKNTINGEEGIETLRLIEGINYSSENSEKYFLNRGDK